MRCLRTRGLVRWDGRRAQGGGSDWYTHHGVRWGSSLTPNGSSMRINAATCPTVSHRPGVGCWGGSWQGRGKGARGGWESGKMPPKRVSLASCQRSALESQFLAPEEVPPFLLLYSSGRVARLLTTIIAVVPRPVLSFATKHLTPKFLPSHGILPMLQPLVGDPPNVLRTPWSPTRRHRCDDSCRIAITDTSAGDCPTPRAVGAYDAMSRTSPGIPPEIKGIKWRTSHLSHPSACRRDTRSSALCCLAGPDGP